MVDIRSAAPCRLHAACTMGPLWVAPLCLGGTKVCISTPRVVPLYLHPYNTLSLYNEASIRQDLPSSLGGKPIS